MIAFAYYLLKMFVCSGLLFLYYHLALRDKIFHQWNRFYLLASIAISLIVPCLEFNIWTEPAKEASNITLLHVVYTADAYVAKANAGRTELSLDQWITIGYGLISLFVLVVFIQALAKIFALIRSNPVMTIDDIKFVDTEESSAPFSFFNYVFWNRQIDLQSTSGEHIFQHELVHVREKHTWDKLFLQGVLTVFWCNPFFFLIRKELKMIHEFIADQKSVGQSDAQAFARMILHAAYPKHYTQLTNHFFHSSIKRRIAMLTKKQNPKINYASRILALPLMAFLMLAFTIKQKANNVTTAEGIINSLSIQDAAQLKPTTETLLNSNGANEFSTSLGTHIRFWKAGQQLNAATPGSVIHFPPLNGSLNPYAENERTVVREGNPLDTPSKDLLIIIDGKEIGRVAIDGKEAASTNQLLQQLIPAEQIESMTVLKGETATGLYGEKAKNGAILLTTKGGNFLSKAPATINTKPNETHTPPAAIDTNGTNPLIVINGKVIGNKNTSTLDKWLSPNDIQSINVLKQGAVEKYGEKARDGVIEIITKEPVNDATSLLRNLPARDTTPYENKVFEKVEVEAQFPGGAEAWNRYLQRTLNTSVPVSKGAPKNDYTVVVQFVVQTDGSLYDVKPLTKQGYGMEEEAVRIIKRGPKWIPAYQNGHKVNAYRKQPISFFLKSQPIE